MPQHFYRQARLAAAFLAIYILWGSTYLAVALGLESIPPFLLMGLRSLGGGLVSWPGPGSKAALCLARHGYTLVPVASSFLSAVMGSLPIRRFESLPA